MNNKKEKIMGMAFFGPALVLLTVFLFIPMILTLVFSFTDFFTLNPSDTSFVGFDNYIRLFKDELFGKAFLNTLKFVVIVVPLQLGGALLLALGINKVTYCKKYFKVAFFIPVVMSLAVVSTLWMQLYNPEGLLNTILNSFGIASQPFIYGKEQALEAISIMSIWQGMGYQMIIFLGGLQAISPSLYEAADLEGASKIHQFFSITLPLVWGTVRTTLTFFIISCINLSFLFVKVMTSGGPDGASETVLGYMYKQAYGNSSYGYGMAIGVVIFLFSFGLSLILSKITEREVIEY